jgi:hypothetical protein
MRGRATELGGRLRIDSARGLGTRLTVEVPAGGEGRLSADSGAAPAAPHVAAGEALGA